MEMAGTAAYQVTERALNTEPAQAGRKTQQDEAQHVWKLVEDLQARNSELVVSCAASAEREAHLQVGASDLLHLGATAEP